jgi:hypothetical protein
MSKPAVDPLAQLHVDIAAGPGDVRDGWSDQRFTFLVAAAKLGWSATQAASKLCVTRNSAIGKAARADVRFNSDGTSGNGKGHAAGIVKISRAKPKDQAPRVNAKVGRGNATGSRLALIKGNAQVVPMIPKVPLPDMMNGAPTGQPKILLHRGSAECAWPLQSADQEADSSTLFCCARVQGDSSFCAPHHRLVFKAAKTSLRELERGLRRYV